MSKNNTVRKSAELAHVAPSKGEKKAAAKAAREAAETTLALVSAQPGAPTVEFDPMDAIDTPAGVDASAAHELATDNGAAFDHEPDPMDVAADEGENDHSNAAPSDAPPASTSAPGTGPAAATAWLEALKVSDPGGAGTSAPWRHAGSAQITRMGLEALARCGVTPNSEMHRKYNAERAHFWALMNGRVPGVRASKGAATHTAGGTPDPNGKVPTPASSPRDALARRVSGYRDTLSAFRATLVDHRAAPLLAHAIANAIGQLEAAEAVANALPADWGHRPVAPAAPAFTPIAGQTVLIAEKLRPQCVSEGMIDADEAGLPMTIKSVANEKLAVCVTASGQRVRMLVRFLVPAPAAAKATAAA